jgi:hypothetical protein
MRRFAMTFVLSLMSLPAFAWQDILQPHPFGPLEFFPPSEDENFPREKLHCLPHVRAAGLDPYQFISFTPLKLIPAAIDEAFRVEAGACYSDGKCRKVAAADFDQSRLNSVVLDLWVLDLGCFGKPSNRLTAIKIQVIKVKSWYKPNESIAVLMVPLNRLVEPKLNYVSSDKPLSFTLEIK